MTPKKFDIVLLCGGRGVRFTEFTDDKLPKSLYPLHGKELIQYTLDTLDMALVGKLIFAVDHHADKMISWIHNQDFPCGMVVVSRQTEPGIAGALKGASAHIDSEHFVICNTDEVRHNFSAKKFLHESLKLINKSTGAMATALSTDLSRHRTITVGSNEVITDTKLKNLTYKKALGEAGVINIGFLLLPKDCVSNVDSICGDGWSSIIDPLVHQRKLFSILFNDVQYFNVGTVAELTEATSFLESSNQDR